MSDVDGGAEIWQRIDTQKIQEGQQPVLQLLTLKPGQYERQDMPIYKLLVHSYQKLTTCTSPKDPLARNIVNVKHHIDIRVLNGPPTLSERTMTYTSTYRPGKKNQPGVVTLVGDFQLNPGFQGRGLGGWIMQQIVKWAKTLPPDTLVQGIHTSPNDEHEDNTARRDRLWEGVGFQFGPREVNGTRYSLPLTVQELLVHERWRRSVDVEPVEAIIAHTLKETKRLQYELEKVRRVAESRRRVLEAIEAQKPEKLIPRVLVQVLLLPFRALDWCLSRVIKG